MHTHTGPLRYIDHVSDVLCCFTFLSLSLSRFLIFSSIRQKKNRVAFIEASIEQGNLNKNRMHVYGCIYPFYCLKGIMVFTSTHRLYDCDREREIKRENVRIKNVRAEEQN